MLHVFWDPAAETLNVDVQASRSATTNKPEERQARIRAELEKRPSFAGSLVVTANSDQASPEALASVHAPAFIAFLKDAHAHAAQVNDCNLFNPVTRELRPYTIWPGADWAVPGVDLPLYAQVGLYVKDFMSPILATTFQSAAKSAQNSLLAADSLWKARHSADPPLLYALNSSPGHHAVRGRASGYCFFNNPALAAQRMLEHGAKRIAVLDVDVHAGDGTQDVFYGSPHVLTVSLHVDPRYEFPFFRGHASEGGDNKGLGFNLNVPLAPKTAWAEYSRALTTALSRIREFGPEFVIVSFGADTFYLDPDCSNISGMQLRLPDFWEMGNAIRAGLPPGMPTMVTAEGGYAMDAVGDITANFLEGLMGRSPSPVQE